MKTEIDRIAVYLRSYCFLCWTAVFLFVTSFCSVLSLFLIERAKRNPNISFTTTITIIANGVINEYPAPPIQSSSRGPTPHECDRFRMQNADPRSEILESDQTFLLPQLADGPALFDNMRDRSDLP